MSNAPTFDGRGDRLTYLAAQYKWFIGPLVVGAGVLLAVYTPDLPAAPEWVNDFLAAFLIFGLPLYAAGTYLAGYLHERHNVVVFEVNAVEDTLQKWVVPPDVWREKTVEGTDPWPVNGGAAWAVRQFDWQEATDDLVVEGVYLSELSDDKLLTAQRHLEEVHSVLLKKYLELTSVRDRISRMGVEAQEKLANAGAEARERGQLLDPDAVESTYQDAVEEAEDLGTDDLPSIEDVDEEFADLSPAVEADDGPQAAADGGGSVEE